MAEKKSRASVADRVFDLARPVTEGLGLVLWDVDYFKEGGSYDLLVTIDRPGGVGLADCEAVSRALSPLLDEADPIEDSYCLEVSSPGLERPLTRPEHFLAYVGKEIKVRLYAPRNGKKILSGTLSAYEDGVLTLSAPEGEIKLSAEERAKCTAADADELPDTDKARSSRGKETKQ